jgi:hypothetical protein
MEEYNFLFPDALSIETGNAKNTKFTYARFHRVVILHFGISREILNHAG